MDLTQTLLALEETFWKAAGDKDAYAANLAPDAEHVFPGWGISQREKVLDSVAAVEPWQSFTIDDLRVVPLGEDAAALVYATRAQRAGQAPYVAAITSVYRRTGGGWELVIHQQTPFQPSPSL